MHGFEAEKAKLAKKIQKSFKGAAASFERAVRKNPMMYEAHSDLEHQVGELSSDYEHVVIDCPPSVQAPQTDAVLRLGDLALVPVQPSPVDLWATVHIEQAIDRAHLSNPSLRALLVINQLEARTTLSRLVRDALSEIGLPVATTALRRRAIYRSSALEGKSVFDMGRRGADARCNPDRERDADPIERRRRPDLGRQRRRQLLRKRRLDG